MWPRIVAGIFIPVGNHYFQALASTLHFVAQVCDRLWLVPTTDRAFAYITYMSPPHVALVCSGPPQKCGHIWLNKVAGVLGPLVPPVATTVCPQFVLAADYQFSSRESCSKGSSLLSVVEMGINRPRLASDCALTVAVEAKRLACEGK